MLNCGSLLFFLLAISVTRIATDMDLQYVDQEPNQYYNEITRITQEKVDLQVYYECLCYGCRIFHVRTLNRLLTELSPYLNFKSYPYGNAKMVQENGRTVVTCQHGEIECYGNKLHACAIDQLQNPILSESFNSCMMAGRWGGRGSSDMDAALCGTSMGVNTDSIISCARSERGRELLETYGRETALVKTRRGVPHVLINGNVFMEAYAYLKTAVCKAFANPPPPCLH